MWHWQKAAEQLREEGAAVLRRAFPVESLTDLKRAADVAFESIARGEVDAGKYRFTPYSYSALLHALREFGADDLMAPVRLTEVESLVAEVMGEEVKCRVDESWVRKRFAPCNAPRLYHPNSWHQDGGLGVTYGEDVRQVGPMTRLLTCWIPLHDCGRPCPGLELVRQKLDGLLHYTELDDARLRKRFAAESFWAPELEFGDGVVLLAGSLHRTHVRPEMTQDRMSLEYRFFPV